MEYLLEYLRFRDIYVFERSQGTERQLVMGVTLEMSIFLSVQLHHISLLKFDRSSGK